jgi:hypothetical protein
VWPNSPVQGSAETIMKRMPTPAMMPTVACRDRVTAPAIRLALAAARAARPRQYRK